MRDHPSDGSVRRARGERRAPSVPRNAPGGAFERRELRLGAKALVTDRDRVLLVKERRADGSTFWSLPGGGVEPGETLSTCLRREIREEIRCPSTVGERVGRCVYQHTSRPATTVYAVFGATIEAEPEPDPAERVVDHAWLSPTDLRPTTLAPVERFLRRSAATTDGGR
jgi:8-oxo-dGTP diphosphatase